MNEILRELYLADNKLMPSDGIQLGNMLKFNHKLALLDLRNNHLQVCISFYIEYTMYMYLPRPKWRVLHCTRYWMDNPADPLHPKQDNCSTPTSIYCKL